MELKQVLQYLVDNAYVLATKEKGYSLSKKFQEDVKRMKQNLPVVSTTSKIPAKKIEQGLVISQLPVSGTVDWIVQFSRFISEAKVPARLEGNRGEEYAANKYSEEGMKVFKKAMETGIDYGTLVKSTMLYYKSSLRFKKAIGNYMTQGDWRSDYNALKEAAEQGTEELKQHLVTETKSNEHNPYRLG